DVYRALAVDDPPRSASDGLDSADDADAVQTVMRFSRDARKDKGGDRRGDGTPALLIRKAGAGQVMLFTTAADMGSKLGSLDPTWTDWPLDRLYLPFLDVAFSQLVRNQAAVHGITCGQPLTWFP